jgi:hypothetical protein
MAKIAAPLASKVAAKVSSKVKAAFVSEPAPAPKIEETAPPSEESIRLNAYLRWDAAGRPGGDGLKFWLEAEQDLRRSKK